MITQYTDIKCQTKRVLFSEIVQTLSPRRIYAGLCDLAQNIV